MTDVLTSSSCAGSIARWLATGQLSGDDRSSLEQFRTSLRPWELADHSWPSDVVTTAARARLGLPPNCMATAVFEALGFSGDESLELILATMLDGAGAPETKRLALAHAEEFANAEDDED
jgi:hypothetical protein